jgi:pimeloyl-ACP methyl ester carboxylesterase
MQTPLERDIDPGEERNGTVHTISRPDGSEIRVECYGPSDAPPIIWTHGWGANSTEWFYQKRYLMDRFRVIVWDIPGMGLSKKPDNNDFQMENLAADLEAVLAVAGNRPAILVGHSIGGMITLTFCKLFPGMLETRVPTLVIVGDKDSSTLPAAGEFIASHVPGAEAVALSPAKHMGLMEHHDRFDRLVAEFAASCLTAIKVS